MKMCRCPLGRAMAAWLTSAALLAFSGCENGGSSAIGDGHDFGNNNPDLVVAFGDSITAGGDVSPSYVPILAGMIGKTVLDEGTPGMESGFGADNIGAVLNQQPGFVLIFFGSNDAIMGRDSSETIDNLQAIVTACKNANVIPVLTTLPPMIGEHAAYNDGVDALNPLIASLAAQEDVPLADVHAAFVGNEEAYLISDGLHPTEAGAEAIATTYANLFR